MPVSFATNLCRESSHGAAVPQRPTRCTSGGADSSERTFVLKPTCKLLPQRSARIRILDSISVVSPLKALDQATSTPWTRRTQPRFLVFSLSIRRSIQLKTLREKYRWSSRIGSLEFRYPELTSMRSMTTIQSTRLLTSGARSRCFTTRSFSDPSFQQTLSRVSKVFSKARQKTVLASRNGQKSNPDLAQALVPMEMGQVVALALGSGGSLERVWPCGSSYEHRRDTNHGGHSAPEARRGEQT